MNECMYEGRLESLTWLTKLTEIGLLKKKKNWQHQPGVIW